uniref:Cytochrome P450 family 2 subfamily AH member 12 n=1 Tax=Sphenodon punctatus TaxID=8508 RepID=A0A8D0HC55_SPHPU
MVLGATIFLAICLACLFVLSAWRRKIYGTKNLPPGPMPLPIIGNFLELKAKNVSESLRRLSDQYGPVFTVYYGSDRVVVLYGYDVVKEVLVNRGDEFINRGSFPSADVNNKGLGLVMSSGERWAQIRRFSLTTLRNFGMGKKGIEERIQDEAEYLREELKAKKGQPCHPALLFSSATANIISHVLLGERFDYNDQEYQKILHLLISSFRLEISRFSLPLQLYNIFPRIMDLLPGPHKTFFKNLHDVQAFISKRVKAHEETFDPNVLRDYVDAFLLKMEQEKHNPQTEFTRENLAMTVYDIFIAGTETGSTSLRYFLLVLLEHPDVEAKIHAEIDRTIGRDRLPSIKDRIEMPYTEAVIHELQRYIDLIPLGLTRLVQKETQIRGYTIPKGSTIYPILSSALHDSNQFENPRKFCPEHFLDDKGAFKKNSADMPFSAGKRNCLGEGLARMQLFLFLTTILQSFRLKHPPGVTQIDLTPDVSGFGNIPRPHLLCFVPR